jgi:hypothetical protein
MKKISLFLIFYFLSINFLYADTGGINSIDFSKNSSISTYWGLLKNSLQVQPINFQNTFSNSLFSSLLNALFLNYYWIKVLYDKDYSSLLDRTYSSWNLSNISSDISTKINTLSELKVSTTKIIESYNNFLKIGKKFFWIN